VVTDHPALLAVLDHIGPRGSGRGGNAGVFGQPCTQRLHPAVEAAKRVIRPQRLRVAEARHFLPLLGARAGEQPRKLGARLSRTVESLSKGSPVDVVQGEVRSVGQQPLRPLTATLHEEFGQRLLVQRTGLLEQLLVFGGNPEMNPCRLGRGHVASVHTLARPIGVHEEHWVAEAAGLTQRQQAGHCLGGVDGIE